MNAEWKMKEDSLSVEDEERTGYSILSRNARSREPNDLVSEGAASVHGAPRRRQNGRGRVGATAALMEGALVASTGVG